MQERATITSSAQKSEELSREIRRAHTEQMAKPPKRRQRLTREEWLDRGRQNFIDSTNRCTVTPFNFR